MKNSIFGLAMCFAVFSSCPAQADTPGSSQSQTVGANQTLSVGSNKTKGPARKKKHSKAGGLKRTTERVEHREGGPGPSGGDKKVFKKKSLLKGSIGGHKHGSDQVSK